MKDLVLGLVKGYDYSQIRPFLSSLRATGYSGDICFYYADLKPATIEALQEQGVELVSFTLGHVNLLVGRMHCHWLIKRLFKSPLKWLLPLPRLHAGLIESLAARHRGGGYAARCRITARTFGIYGVRHSLYYLHLLERGANYRRVMLTDVRDVLFQRNPFDFPMTDELCVFLEDEREPIRACRINARWVREACGQEALREIGQETISCAGVTMGSREAVMRYLELMVDHMIRARFCPGAMDQGVHNYVLHKRLVKARLFRNGAGPVLTMAKTVDLPTAFNDEGQVLNDDGSVPHVLHQYDRHVAAGKLALVEQAEGVKLIAA